MRTRTVLLVATSAAVTCLPFLVSSKDNPAQAKARDAVRQEMARRNEPTTSRPASRTRSATTMGPREDTEGQALARKAVREEVSILATAAMGFTGDLAALSPTEGPREDTQAQAMAREQVRLVTPVAVVATQTEAGEPAGPQAPPAPRATATKAEAANPFARGMRPAGSPFTAEQQAALAEILAPYLANQMSSKEYHQKRAAIIAGS